MKVDELLAEAVAIEAEEAQKAGAVGYMARLLAQATMPHSKTSELHHSRTNGLLTVRIIADPFYGLPYGHYPRILLSWMTTEAVRTKSPVLTLGRNLSEFMEQLDLIPAGGRWGSITRLRNHLDRLFGCSITSTEETGKGHRREISVKPIEARELWWDHRHPEQGHLWQSKLMLSPTFFKTITDRPIPLDLRILRALARLRSPMAIDIYCWLTYRASYIREPMKRPIAYSGHVDHGFRSKPITNSDPCRSLIPVQADHENDAGVFYLAGFRSLVKFLRIDSPFSLMRWAL